MSTFPLSSHLIRDDMTAQEIFNTVYTHLLKQNAKSNGEFTRIHPDGEKEKVVNCVYRNPDGLKCAAGCLTGSGFCPFCREGKTTSDGGVFRYICGFSGMPEDSYQIYVKTPCMRYEVKEEEIQGETAEKLCDCNGHTLLHFGCQCGGK